MRRGYSTAARLDMPSHTVLAPTRCDCRRTRFHHGSLTRCSMPVIPVQRRDFGAFEFGTALIQYVPTFAVLVVTESRAYVGIGRCGVFKVGRCERVWLWLCMHVPCLWTVLWHASTCLGWPVPHHAHKQACDNKRCCAARVDTMRGWVDTVPTPCSPRYTRTTTRTTTRPPFALPSAEAFHMLRAPSPRTRRSPCTWVCA